MLSFYSRHTSQVLLSALLGLCAACSGPMPDQVVCIDLNEKGGDINAKMYGIFIEDINEAGDGALYAEMVKNRSFEDSTLPPGYQAHGDTLLSPLTYNHVTGQWVQVRNRWDASPVPGWTIIPEDAACRICDATPCFSTAPHYLQVATQDSVRLVNAGYGGFGLHAQEVFQLRVIARPKEPNGALVVRFISDGGAVLGSTLLTFDKQGQWNDVRTELTASTSCSDAKLELVCRGAIDLDYVSLMPAQTFHNHGMRSDVAEMIQSLHPAFVRWPGGCVVEGITLSTRFKWKEALGDPASRPGLYNLWGYRGTCGIGWPEMLQFCEDLGAEAMYVCNVGMACQAQTSELSSQADIDLYLQDCLDAIEYAIGDSQQTPWGMRRAADGHPAPYPLRFVEIGNENWGPRYDERYNRFHQAIKQRWPQLTLICNYGIDGTQGVRQTDMVDPHWYVAPDFFLNNTAIFDTINRQGPQIYVGEYACNRSVGSGNMYAALGEAAFLLGAESNGDVVRMASYAPLLESSWYRAWPTNLIWVSPTQVMGRSSYWVQRLMAEHLPTHAVSCTPRASMPEPRPYPRGAIGLGTWKSNVEFRDLQVTLADGTVTTPDLSAGKPYVGTWHVNDEGTLCQTEILPRCKYMLPEVYDDHYTITLKGRKTAGKDAFLVFFGMDPEAQDGLVYSIGGKNNSKACVEGMLRGENTGEQGMLVDFHAEMGQWYNLRIEVTPDSSRLYVDGQYLLTHHLQTPVQHVHAAGFDQKTQELILKTVNVGDTPYTVQYQVRNGMLASQGRSYTLAANQLDDENSFSNPEQIVPVAADFAVGGEPFTYTFPPHSFTILRIPCK